MKEWFSMPTDREAWARTVCWGTRFSPAAPPDGWIPAASAWAFGCDSDLGWRCDMHDTDTTELSAAAGACCKSSRRNRFFRRKQMRAEEFETEQRYLIGRRRLINRAVLGWGVVSGFALREHHEL